MHQQIVIWDLSAQRIQAMEANLQMAMKKLGIEAGVQFNCEEPLISRNGLLGKLPAVQVNGDKKVWQCGAEHVISEDEFIALFHELRKRGLLAF